MHDQDFSVDIHCHPTLRAYMTPSPGPKRNYWEKTQNPDFKTPISRWARMRTAEIAKESQTNFYSMAEGEVKVIFDSLYPVEKSFLEFRKISKFLSGQRARDQVLSTSTGIDPKRLNKFRRRGDYFGELLDLYAFLVKNQGKSPDRQYSYALVNDFDDLVEMRTHHPNSIAVVPTIEGGHVFGTGTPDAMRVPTKELGEILSENIETVKSWEFPPLFINLAHHFWNQLAGHSRSFKPMIQALYNQSTGMNKGITELGWHVIQELYTKSNGPRVLIDIKHMSMRSRMEYYKFIQRQNYINPDDKIPIICSHTGVSGFKTMKGAINKADTAKKMKKSYFHNWSINLCDEEILIIHESGGMIGIMMDKGILGSPRTLNAIESEKDQGKQKQAFIRLLLDNVFRMVKAIGDRSAWDTISMGTDYDGLITHIPFYPEGASIRELRADLQEFLFSRQYKKELWFDYTPEQLVRKVMQENPVAFLKKHLKKHNRQPQDLSSPSSHLKVVS